MNSLVIELKKPIAPDLAADLVKQGAYISPDIVAVDLDGNSFRCDVKADADLHSLQGKVERYVDLMVSRHRHIPQKVLCRRERPNGGALEVRAYDKLIERGWVKELGRGQVALAGPALRALQVVDADCRELGRRFFDASEETYPTLIPSSTLAKCGYFSSFPQSVSMVTHLIEDLDLIESFRRANVDRKDLCVPDSSALKTPDVCLSPAVCYHCYRGLEGAVLAGKPHVVTSVGKCFRFESTNMVGLDRLWDFTMREVIFVGTREQVSSRRERGIELVKEQLEKWDLEGSIETANDPFFSATYAVKKFHQVLSDLKFEVRLAVGTSGSDSRAIACGSFNLHEDFFGKTFAITASDGQPAHTGCVAWGLERWVLALFAQHGFASERWPEALRAKVWE